MIEANVFMSLLRYRPRSVATALSLLALTACGDVRDVTEPEPPRAASLSISPATVEFGIPGETAELAVTVLDQHGNAFPAPFTWASEDASVISVDQNGVATAVARGTAAIRVVAGDLSAVVQASVNSSVDRRRLRPDPAGSRRAHGCDEPFGLCTGERGAVGAHEAP